MSPRLAAQISAWMRRSCEIGAVWSGWADGGRGQPYLIAGFVDVVCAQGLSFGRFVEERACYSPQQGAELLFFAGRNMVPNEGTPACHN